MITLQEVSGLVYKHDMRDFTGPSARCDLLARAVLGELAGRGGQELLREVSPGLAEEAQRLQRSYDQAEFTGHYGRDLLTWRLLKDIDRAVGAAVGV